jgi:hypothetical protein
VTESFDDILAAATLPERPVPMCLAGNLVGEAERLQAELAAVGPAASLGDRTRADLQDRLAQVQTKMRAATRVFTVRAMQARPWTTYWANWPTQRDGEADAAWQDRLWPTCVDLVSKICVDPAMTTAQVEQLAERLHSRAWNQLVNACIAINVQDVDVPNFVAGSGPTQDSEPA